MKNNIKVNLKELEYILTNFLKPIKKKSIEIVLDEESIENIRDLALNKLETHGFDENYDLNNEGNILQSLIDKLYR
ncbi:hypothetical protein [Kordia jejudonensis]|uniref:hypothetical protein n=1 Tax=Kordia jejudonensis TaxID=1348245 RepID=UPI0006292588|nr:hypothetical protein [Kordia jejudonensis]